MAEVAGAGSPLVVRQVALGGLDILILFLPSLGEVGGGQLRLAPAVLAKPIATEGAGLPAGPDLRHDPAKPAGEPQALARRPAHGASAWPPCEDCWRGSAARWSSDSCSEFADRSRSCLVSSQSSFVPSPDLLPAANESPTRLENVVVDLAENCSPARRSDEARPLDRALRQRRGAKNVTQGRRRPIASSGRAPILIRPLRSRPRAPQVHYAVQLNVCFGSKAAVRRLADLHP